MTSQQLLQHESKMTSADVPEKDLPHQPDSFVRVHPGSSWFILVHVAFLLIFFFRHCLPLLAIFTYSSHAKAQLTNKVAIYFQNGNCNIFSSDRTANFRKTTTVFSSKFSVGLVIFSFLFFLMTRLRYPS